MDAADPKTAYCTGMVHEFDRDRYLANLFAPEPARSGLMVLHAFNSEVARIREMISNPMAGEVRLQWWSDTLIGQARGDIAAHPVAAALLEVVERHKLPRQTFFSLLDARVFDLYDDPMPTVNDLEGYAGETSSALIRLGTLILTGASDRASADAAGHAGVAYAVTGLLRAFPHHARRGQCYVPLELLHAHGVGRDEAVSGIVTSGLLAALADMRELARRHYRLAMAALAAVDPANYPAFLPLSLVPDDLARLDRLRDPFMGIAVGTSMTRIWRLWRASRNLVGRRAD